MPAFNLKKSDLAVASCSYCNSLILFGGVTDQTGRYCNTDCQQAGHLLAVSHSIPPHLLSNLIDEVHRGDCPRCHGRGPVDVHKAHRVWSALVLTSWKSSPELSCKRCAIKRQIGASLFSGVLGWWGFPWGLVMTPVQIIHNLVEMFGGPAGDRPSPMLEKMVRLQAAAHAIAAGQATPASAPPRIPPAAVSPASANDDRRYQPR